MSLVKLSLVQNAVAGLWNSPPELPRPLKLERRLILGRWVGIAVFAVALALNITSMERTIAGYCVLGVAFAYNLVLLRVLRHATPGLVVGLPTLADGLLCAAMIPLMGGFESPFYAVMYAVTVAAGMRLGFGRGMLLAAAVSLIDGSSRLIQGDDLGAALIVRSGVLVLTVILTSFLYDEAQKAEAALAERLHQSEVLNGALEHQALHDLLTGLPNRTLLHRRVEQSIAAAATGDASVALLVIDLDRFKEVNDTFGHQYGDLLLQQIGPRLSDVLEPEDTISRLGGDEFAVLLPGANAVRAEQVARKLLAALDRSFAISDISVDVGGSIGIALSPEHAADSDVLLRRADVAMYVAKRAGRGFALYSPDQDQHSPDRLAMVGDLRRAIEGDELTLHYQPKVSLRTSRCIGVEALIRWQHPQHGLTIVAEGIEDAGTWDLLRRLGCDIAQGYFIGRPMSATALVASLGNSQLSLAA